VAVRARNITGAAGEYHVAAELSRRGWLATVTIKNSPDTDVLAQKPESELLVAIQTKTSGGNSFRLKEKDEAPSKRDGQWFVLVALAGELERPRFYVVPHDHIAAMVFLAHREWLVTPGVRGQPHNENPQRSLRADELTGYLERWELLEEATHAIPFLGGSRFPGLVEKHGLPAAHPGLVIAVRPG
jgi:hypothetical protein